MALISGTRLGPYEILSPIGKGGMGEVYKATDTRLDRTVAIKVLPEHLAESPERKARFEREAKAISQLNHPHNTHFSFVLNHFVGTSRSSSLNQLRTTWISVALDSSSLRIIMKCSPSGITS